MDAFFIVFVICGAILGVVSFFVGYYIFKKVNGNTSAKIIVIASPITLILIVLSMYDCFIRRGVEMWLDWLGIILSLIVIGFTIYVFVTNIIALKKSQEEN